MRSIQPPLLEALHGGLFEQPLWSKFLDQLRAHTGAVHVALVVQAPGGDSIELHAGPPVAPSASAADGLWMRNMPGVRQMRVGRVYALDELLDSAKPQQRIFREEALVPLGITAARCVRVTEPSGVDAWLGCAGDKTMGSATGATLTALVPHLLIALRSYVALERERFRSNVASDAFRRMNFGWLMLEGRCRIVDAAPHADQLLQRSPVLRRDRYDRLTPVSPAADRELTALVRQFAANAQGRPRAITLSRDPWTDMLVVPALERNSPAASPPVAIAYISGDRLSQADRCEELVDLFGLLPSEARLAWAMAQGLSIAEAATDLGLTLETARNYSKKIYGKTGARGQTDLVRIILTSMLALA